MFEHLTQPGHNAIALTRDLAEQHLAEIAALANRIPGVEYTPKDILAEQKGERKMLNKWSHSLIVMDGNELVAFIMGYERASEDNDQYPVNTLYISELAVAEPYQHQGIAKSLLRQFFEKNNETGFQSLEGNLNYSVQTNSADWNQHVVGLYQSFGFKQRATKQYPNRVDVVLGAEQQDIVSP